MRIAAALIFAGVVSLVTSGAAWSQTPPAPKAVAAPQAAPAPEPDSPAEALDRLTIPADAMARITEALSTGGSIIVSDQGIAAGETGEGTDFIVSLR